MRAGGQAAPDDIDGLLDPLPGLRRAQGVPRKHRPDQRMYCCLQIGIRAQLTAVHATLKDRNLVVPAGAYDPFAEQLEQLGVATLLDQQGADHGEARAPHKRNLGLNDHFEDIGACAASVLVKERPSHVNVRLIFIRYTPRAKMVGQKSCAYCWSKTNLA